MTCATWSGEAGAPITATAATCSSREAAAMTAAPPSECPTSSRAGATSASNHSAAATRSPTLLVKEVSAKSPSDEPRPVKSKRSTAKPRSASARDTRVAAVDRREQVKQCAKRAAPATGPSGVSRVPVIRWPSDPSKWTVRGSALIAVPLRRAAT